MACMGSILSDMHCPACPACCVFLACDASCDVWPDGCRDLKPENCLLGASNELKVAGLEEGDSGRDRVSCSVAGRDTPDRVESSTTAMPLRSVQCGFQLNLVSRLLVACTALKWHAMFSILVRCTGR